MPRRIRPALAALLRDASRGVDFTAYHAREYTGVKRLPLDTVSAFEAQVLEGPGWRTLAKVDAYATAEAIARGYRIDHRGARTRITEQRRPLGGFTYVAV